MKNANETATFAITLNGMIKIVRTIRRIYINVGENHNFRTETSKVEVYEVVDGMEMFRGFFSDLKPATQAAIVDGFNQAEEIKLNKARAAYLAGLAA